MRILADGGPDRIITERQLQAHLEVLLAGYPDIKRLLLLPPDITRLNSMAGEITAYLYNRLKNRCEIRIMPALGTHAPMTEKEIRKMFGPDIPFEAFLPHRWRDDLVILGELSGEFISEITGGLLDFPMEIGVNKELIDGQYDLILSIGQVVPHEVIGMANYTKNILVGTGGGDTINKSHFIGAVCGMENILGKIDTPVRKALNTGFDRFVRDKVNVMFIMSVIGKEADDLVMRGLFIGDDHETFAEACKLSQAVNLITLPKPANKCVVYLDPEKFKSTWLGNKSIYRTCMAIADGGELIILAPGLQTFGEDAEIDRMIRKYGYFGTESTLKAVKENEDIRNSLSAAAHAIKSASNGRYKITYCPGDGLSREEIEGVGFEYAPYQETADRYQLPQLKDGWNSVDGEEFFYISNPALGLWQVETK